MFSSIELHGTFYDLLCNINPVITLNIRQQNIYFTHTHIQSHTHTHTYRPTYITARRSSPQQEIQIKKKNNLLFYSRFKKDEYFS